MYKKTIYFLLFFLLNSCSVLLPSSYTLKSNQKKADQYSKTITQKELKKHLKIISSDEFEGRETTTIGQKKAAAYIKKHFVETNIKGAFNDTGYFQDFPVDVLDFSKVNFYYNKNKLTFIDDFYPYGNPTNKNCENTSIVNVGYGIITKERNDYLEKDTKGKVVFIKQGLPADEIIDNKEGNWRRKVYTASKRGAIGIVFLKSDYANTDLRIKEHLKNPFMQLHGNQKSKPQPPVFIVDEKKIKTLNQATNTISFNTRVSQTKTGENVLGFIPGVTDEIIVISAHYDHIGYDRGEICNGADDDGSGTSSLLSISKAFQKAFDEGNKPQRGILFLAVSGEEKGLFGSQFYTENPVFPLSKTIADLNIDMVGRQDTIQQDNNYIYLIGSDRISKELHNISEQINKKHLGFKLDYTYNAKDDPNNFYQRSDHYNFAKNNIPVIFYFGGLHEDYHQPTDDFEKIDFLKLQRVSRLVFLTAWELAYRKKKLSK
tara:strand:+ start:2295 stop:3758 length:1464 start_codon:yes stop_codon:yes gene_type:complete